MPYGLPSGAELRNLLVLQHSDRARATAAKYRVWTPQGWHDSVALTEREREASMVAIWGQYISGHLGNLGLAAGGQWSNFSLEFFKARAQSIDRFIQFHHSRWGEVARAAVASVILNCEDDTRLDLDWYSVLLDQIAPKPDALKEGALSIVTFNYDRSFECYFHNAFSAQYGLDTARAGEMFNRIKIEHVYGSLGSLDNVGYGNKLQIGEAVKEIDFMRPGGLHEKRDSINSLIRQAENVCFLGFSFADENLALFEPTAFKKKRLIAATSYGLSQNRMNAAKARIKSIKFWPLSGFELLNDQDIFRAPKARQANQETPKHPRMRHVENPLIGGLRLDME